MELAPDCLQWDYFEIRVEEAVNYDHYRVN